MDCFKCRVIHMRVAGDEDLGAVFLETRPQVGEYLKLWHERVDGSGEFEYWQVEEVVHVGGSGYVIATDKTEEQSASWIHIIGKSPIGTVLYVIPDPTVHGKTSRHVRCPGWEEAPSKGPGPVFQVETLNS